MPLWIIYHTPDSFVDTETKQAFAKDITKFYQFIGLPAFYVVVNFIVTPPGVAFKGGEIPDKPFIRISIEHIAVHQENKAEEHHRATTALEALMKPHIADKGYDYEYHCDETERNMWRVNGFIPPTWGSEAEKKWAALNKAVPYTAEENAGEQKILVPSAMPPRPPRSEW